MNLYSKILVRVSQFYNYEYNFFKYANVFGKIIYEEELKFLPFPFFVPPSLLILVGLKWIWKREMLGKNEVHLSSMRGITGTHLPYCKTLTARNRKIWLNHSPIWMIVKPTILEHLLNWIRLMKAQRWWNRKYSSQLENKTWDSWPLISEWLRWRMLHWKTEEKQISFFE